ncbi:MAG: tail fiber domain-containing protein [Ekhidna sp.]
MFLQLQDLLLTEIIISNANIYASGALTFSDERYKKEIVPLKNVGENLAKLEGVSYYWKKDEFPDNDFSERQQIGLIAQEVEKVFPELVNTLPNGYKTVNYQALVPVLIEALKEQQKLIDKLIADLTEEKASAADLKNALEDQRKLSAMQLEIMSKLQEENTDIKSDVEMLKEIVLGTKTADKKD